MNDWFTLYHGIGGFLLGLGGHSRIDEIAKE
jgi:hypothetical protein